jgi:hypothetical protein
MTTYLSMNGTSDYLQLPTMTMKKFVIDAYWELPATNYHMLLDTRVGEVNGYVYAMADGSTISAGATFSLSPAITFNTRQTVTFNAINNIDGNGNFTDNPTIFANNTGGENYKGKIYSIKCYNASNVLIANYDMTTGTVQDQTGNGNHATLTGGTWLNYNVLVSDSFNRVNNTTSLGTTDSYAGGTAKAWQIFGNAVYGINNNQAYVSQIASSGHGSAYVEVNKADVAITVTFSNIDPAEFPKIAFRIVDAENMLMLMADTGTGNYLLYKYVSGSSTDIATGTTFTNGDTIRVEASGSNIKVFKNGTNIINVTETSYQTATKHGLMLYKYPNSRLDNFIVEDLATGNSYTVNLSDSISLSDSITNKTVTSKKTLTDSLSLVDNPIVKRATYNKSLADTITLTDSLSRQYSALKSLVDSIALTDSMNSNFSNGVRTYQVTLNDSIILSDSINKRITVVKTLNDSITLSDTLNKQVSSKKTLTDTVNLVDSVTGNLIKVNNYQVTLRDSISLTDHTDDTFFTYEQLLITTFTVNQNLSLDFTIQPNIETEFKINQKLETTFII